jgi:hypothetical protein
MAAGVLIFSPFFEIALVLLRFYHVAGFVEDADNYWVRLRA